MREPGRGIWRSCTLVSQLINIVLLWILNFKCYLRYRCEALNGHLHGVDERGGEMERSCERSDPDNFGCRRASYVGGCMSEQVD